VGIRGEIANVNVALVLVLFVLLGACIGGRSAGAMSALAAATAFDFFHTRPYGSLKIARGNDIVTTVLLLVVGLVIGEIAGRTNRLRATIRDDQRRLRSLHRVAELAVSGERGDLVLAVTAELMETLHLEDCQFERPPFAAALPPLERDGTVSTSVHRYTHDGFELPRGGVELRVVGRGETVGRFVLAPTPGVGVSAQRLLVAVALADQLGLALTPMAA
jgi:two-component system sensor histidine kinase KdpD